MRYALGLALALVACDSPVEDTPTIDPTPAVVDQAPAESVMRYFSGNYPNLMNHPALWWTRGETSVVVSGRGAFERFELARLDDAIARYEALLVANNYVPEGYVAPPAPDPNAMVVVDMNDLMPAETEAGAEFTPEQMAAIRDIAPVGLWRHFTGRDGSAHDRVVLYGGGGGLAFAARDADEVVPWAESRRALALFARTSRPPHERVLVTVGAGLLERRGVIRVAGRRNR